MFRGVGVQDDLRGAFVVDRHDISGFVINSCLHVTHLVTDSLVPFILTFRHRAP